VARLTEKIFAKAQICASFIALPQARIGAMEASGELDGDGARVPGFLDDKPYLVMAPTPYVHFGISLYWPVGSKEPKGDSATIAALAGTYWARQMANRFGTQLFEAKSYDQLLRLVQSGHVQAVLIPTAIFQNIIAAHQVSQSLQGREVATMPLHVVVNRRYAALVPALDRAIAALIADGTVTAILFPPAQ
jgi:ABC-type amino acid transport substrate-binding protein